MATDLIIYSSESGYNDYQMYHQCGRGVGIDLKITTNINYLLQIGTR